MAVESLESVARFTAILAAVSQTKGATITELTRQVSLSRAAVNRYVVSLLNLSYIYRDERSHRYRATSKTMELSKGASREQLIRETVLPALISATHEIGWPINLSTVKNAQLTLVAHSDAASPFMARQRDYMQMRPLIGRASGYVLLAFMPFELRQDVLKVALSYNPNLFTDAETERDNLESTLSEVRKQGYAVGYVSRAKINTLAVPLIIEDDVLFSVSAGIYESVLSHEELTSRLLLPLRNCATKLSSKMTGINSSLLWGVAGQMTTDFQTEPTFNADQAARWAVL